ncbi:amidase [Pontivivens nitratireducens]|uniref:amidase n=1 Tax=Pontivivens nitratireducens TaxID=2758038 RepID=UPI00163A3156|nr:amidase [Pontibrevibacter nitratireducens]
MTVGHLQSLHDMSEALASGKMAFEVPVKEHLERITAVSDKLNCRVEVEAETALERARTLDKKRAAGQLRGPLHGIPLVHKDMFHDAGRLSEYGRPAIAGHRADRTGTLMKRLNDAGEVTLGRLHMNEFAMGPTGHNAHIGRCRNPWNTDYVTGGSSSGSGAAVAAGLAAGALGSDTGGSVRLPAAMCDDPGLKPTQGLLPQDGMMGLSERLDCPGVLARSSRDVAVLFNTLAGNGEDYAVGIGKGVERLCFGIPESWYFDDLDPQVAAQLDRTRKDLESEGASFRDVASPDHTNFGEMANIVFTPEATALHADRMKAHPEHYGAQVFARLPQGLAISAVQYRQALQLRAAYAHAMMTLTFSECDMLFAPVLRRLVPTDATTDVQAGSDMRAVIAGLSDLTRPVSYLGFPALSVPAGFDDAGLPVALQLIGPPLSEKALLRAGDVAERDVGLLPTGTQETGVSHDR